MQFIQDSNMGGRLGAALSTGLQSLADIKLNQLQNQYAQAQQKYQYAQGLAPLVGADTARLLGSLSPEERKVALSNLGSLMQLQELQQHPQQQEALQFLAQPTGNEDVQPDLPKNVARILGMTPGNAYQDVARKVVQEGIPKPMSQMGEERLMEPSLKGMRVPPSQQDRAQLIQDIFTSPAEKRQREALELQKRGLFLKEQQAALKETKQYVDSVIQQEKGAKENDLRLKRMEKIIEKGNLPNPTVWSFLSKIEDAGVETGGAAGGLGGSRFGGIGSFIGGMVGSLASPLAGAAKSMIRSGSPDIEEFEKLSADFVKNAKQYFGSRLTDADLRAYMQTIPNLMQTDAGKKRVIDNLRSINEMAQLEAKALRSILKEHDGIRPLDIEQQVKDRISGRLDELADQFIIR